jgi:DNA processing protein
MNSIQQDCLFSFTLLILKMNDLLYRIALTLIPNVGCIPAKSLVEHFESAEAVF